ncbi:MAG: PKD repeat protein, partial [Flavobacteriaceae bacterium]
MKAILITTALLFSTLLNAQTWQDVGGGTNNSSHGMLVWNGELINLGSFNNPCNRVASWDGTNWSCLGGGVGIVARAATVWNGKLVVVGDFWNVQQPCVGCNGVAVWDGVAWTPLGNGVNNDVLSVTVWNNQVVIAGDFTQADGVPVTRIVRWDGTTWQSMGTIGDFDNDIRAMVEFEGELWAGGDFNNVGGSSSSDGLVKWDVGMGSWEGGNSGVDLVGGVNETVRVLYVNPNDGNLYMGGAFPELWDGDAAAQDFNMSGVAMYDGSNWTPLGTGLNDYVRAIHEYNGDIVCGGFFTDAGGTPANKIARFNPVTSGWSGMGLGFDAIGIDEYVKSAAVWNGTFFAGGAYTQAEGNPMNYVAQWYEPPTAPPVAWMTTSATSICAGQCIDFLDNSTNAPASWNWSFPGSDTPTSILQDPGTVCYATAGSYTATLQACNSFGCNTQNLSITIENAPSLTVNDASICDGAAATLTAVPSIGGGSFLWSPGGQTSASIIVNPASNASYTVQYFMPGCNSNIATSNVTVESTPTVTITPGSTICDGQIAPLTATPSSGGGTYLWSPTSEIGASINATPSVTTNYSVIYTLNGCSSTPASNTIIVNPSPSVAVSNEFICDGGSTTLNATPSSGGGTYLWSPGSEVTSSITYSPATTTAYSVVYTLNGCPSTSEIGTITVTPTPTLTVNDETICDGSSATIIGTPSASGGTYLWSPGSQITSTINVSPFTTTNYSVVYTLNGCPSASSSGTVTVIPEPTLTVNNVSICEGSSGTLTATPGTGGGTYLWTTGGEMTASITNSPSATTSYSVVYTLNGCPSASTSGTIIVTPEPLLSVDNVSICEGSSGTLTATPGTGGGTYLWTTGGEMTASITNSPSTTASYSVIYTLNGCPSQAETGTITVLPIPTVSSNDLTICSGTEGTLTATSATAGGSYLWSPGGEVTASIQVNPSTTTSYTVIYTVDGCESPISTSNVTVIPLPNVSVTEAANVLTADEVGAQYQWLDCNNNDAVIPGETNQVYNAPQNGSYAVEVSLGGCLDTSDCFVLSTIGIDEISVYEIFVYPNPVGSQLSIQSEYPLEGVAFDIIDSKGSIVLMGKLTDAALIATTQLVKGEYMLR